MKNVRVIFLKKNKLGSNDSEMYNSARNGKKKKLVSNDSKSPNSARNAKKKNFGGGGNRR